MATERPNKNPYSAFNFIVEINGDAVAAFQEVSGLDSENTPIEYREGADAMNTVRKLPGIEKYPNLTLQARHHRLARPVGLAEGGPRRRQQPSRRPAT